MWALAARGLQQRMFHMYKAVKDAGKRAASTARTLKNGSGGRTPVQALAAEEHEGFHPRPLLRRLQHRCYRCALLAGIREILSCSNGHCTSDAAGSGHLRLGSDRHARLQALC